MAISLERNTAIPQIPSLTGVDPTLQRVLGPIKAILETREGTPKNTNILDKNVTLRDLYEANVIDVIQNGVPKVFTGGNRYKISAVINPGADRTPPPAPTGFTTIGALANVMLSWTSPTVEISATEVWRSVDQSLANAAYIGATTTNSYADDIGAGGIRYYWVRHVSPIGIIGPFNAVLGTLGETSYDFAYAMDILTIKWIGGKAYDDTVPDYVIPNPASETGLWYKATIAGTSGGSEPTWPSVIGNTVVDGTVTWEAVAAGNPAIPFLIGEVAGVPSVIMDTVFIRDAAITNAKIGLLAVDTANIALLAVGSAQISDLIADKITAGTITGSTLQTSASGKRFVVSASNDEAEFWGDRGDGTIEHLAHIGLSIPSGFSDATILAVGTTSSLRTGIYTVSSTKLPLVMELVAGTQGAFGISSARALTNGEPRWAASGAANIYATGSFGVMFNNTTPAGVPSPPANAWEQVGRRPALISSWLLFATGSNYTVAHGVDYVPRTVELQWSLDSSGNKVVYTGWGYNDGTWEYFTEINNAQTYVDATNVKFRTSVTGGRFRNATYVRVLAWR